MHLIFYRHTHSSSSRHFHLSIHRHIFPPFRQFFPAIFTSIATSLVRHRNIFSRHILLNRHVTRTYVTPIAISLPAILSSIATHVHTSRHIFFPPLFSPRQRSIFLPAIFATPLNTTSHAPSIHHFLTP